MDYAVELAAIEQQIEGLVSEQTSLQMQAHQITLSNNEKEKLACIDEELEFLRASAEHSRKLIKLSANDALQVSKNFTEADNEWVESITGVDTSYRKWHNYSIDLTIEPRPGFKTSFEEVGKAFHMINEGGRRIFLNLFLRDVLLRPEFHGSFRIFLEQEISVETKGPNKRMLKGSADYTVRFVQGKGIFDYSVPKEMHMVLVEASERFGQEKLWQCIAKASALYKICLDAGKSKKCVWGILSNAVLWQFIFIDDSGLVWQSDPMLLNLRFYDEPKVLQVYRVLHHIFKCCYESIC